MSQCNEGSVDGIREYLLERTRAAKRLLLPFKTHKYVPQLDRMTLRSISEKTMWLATMARALGSDELCANLKHATEELNIPTSDKQCLQLRWRKLFLGCLEAAVQAVLKSPLTLQEVQEAERKKREDARDDEQKFVESFERFSVAIPKVLQDALKNINHVQSGRTLLVPKEDAEFVRNAARGTEFVVRPIEKLRLLSEQ
jgi:hypothetical protein